MLPRMQGDIALIGLAVMGQNLILNMNDHDNVVVAFNRTVSKVDEVLATGRCELAGPLETIGFNAAGGLTGAFGR